MLSLFKYFLKAKKVWTLPKKNELLIFDQEGIDFLMPYCGEWTYEILHIRGEQINIPIAILAIFEEGKFSKAYRDTYIKRVDPKLVITFIDNTKEFYTISSQHKKIKTILIQNGIRGRELFDELANEKYSNLNLKVDYMLVFNESIGKLFKKNIDGSVISIGSLRNNLFYKKEYKKLNKILYISQYRNIPNITLGNKVISHKSFFEEVDRFIINYLVDFAQKNNMALEILLSARSNHKSEIESEINYFKNKLKLNVNFSYPRKGGSSYQEIDEAEIVVAVDSTLGYESLSRGNKTAIFSIRKELLQLEDRAFGWPGNYPDTGFFWTTQPNLEIFENILQNLRGITLEKFCEILENIEYQNVLAYDKNNIFLQKLLQSEMNKDKFL